jgi:hypothetical protein
MVIWCTSAVHDVALPPGGLEQALDLGLGQVLTGPIGAVRLAAGCDCSVFGGWGDDLEARFHWTFPSASNSSVRIVADLRTVGKD